MHKGESASCITNGQVQAPNASNAIRTGLHHR
jgi:hypothetical protein